MKKARKAKREKKVKRVRTTTDEVLLHIDELVESDLDELRQFADRVGVGYKDLDVDQLRQKLMSDSL